MKKDFLLIVDGSSLLATSYYASLPKPIRKEKNEEVKETMYPVLLRQDSQGHYCNALDLFFHTLFTIMTFQRPSHLVICWDAGRNTFRKELWPAYKSNRQTTPSPLRQQFETAYTICEQLGICQVRDVRYEADDFAGSIACQMAKHLPVRILTRDKDYFQLINDRIQIWYGMADLEKVKQWRRAHQMPSSLPSRVVLVDEKVLKKEFGYSPASVPMIKSLFGDPSDNIPGVAGMGESRSILLAEHYHTIEELYAPIEAAKTKADRKRLFRLWNSWGIGVSPYTVLTRKGNEKRLDAKSMAQLCYTLGKIRTDLDLSDCFEKPYGPELFRVHFDAQTIAMILKPYSIELTIGRNNPYAKKKRKALRRAKAHAKVGKCQADDLEALEEVGLLHLVSTPSQPAASKPKPQSKTKAQPTKKAAQGKSIAQKAKKSNASNSSNTSASKATKPSASSSSRSKSAPTKNPKNTLKSQRKDEKECAQATVKTKTKKPTKTSSKSKPKVTRSKKQTSLRLNHPAVSAKSVQVLSSLEESDLFLKPTQEKKTQESLVHSSLSVSIMG